MELSKMMTLSTAHIPQHTAEALGGLNDHQEASLYPHVVYTPWGDSGWIFWAGQEGYEFCEEHPELNAAIEFAHNHGCDYLMLDCDADSIDALPTFEW